MVAPCWKCNERELGCHASCEKYLAFRKEREIVYAGRKADSEKYYKAPVAENQRPSKSYTCKKRANVGKTERRNLMVTEF